MDIQVHRALKQKAAADRAVQLAMEAAYPPGAGIEWEMYNRGCSPTRYVGVVRRLGSGGRRILVLNQKTGRERWITIGSVA